ncbi:MAG: four helix bundle protein [Acidobacteria bacterium]|nr:four helix bundle protein [Acidobacteriota bacterium]
MKKNILLEKSYNFALRIVRLCRFLQDGKKEYVISKQLLYSGTNVGAFVEESQQGEDRPDSVHLLTQANKSATKTNSCLRLIRDSNYLNETMFQSVFDDCVGLQKILVRTIITTEPTTFNYQI